MSEPSSDEPQPSVIRRNPNEDHRAAQPSATVRTHDFGEVYTGKQPSAPTADVEKIARKVGLELIGKSGSEVEAILAKYFAQVSAAAG